MMRASTFFEGINQSSAMIGDDEFKVPAFYYDGEQITGIFPARMSGLKKMLPDRRMAPARIAPGVGAIIVTCFEYRDCDIGPYNELAIAIPLNEPYYRPNLPGRAMLDAMRRNQFDTWVHHLPVTTQVACDGGVQFYNYPKFVASIDFSQDAQTRTCRLAEGAEHILTLNCKRLKGRRTKQVQLFSHLYQNLEPQSAEFKINAHELGTSAKPGAATLEPGDRHPVALELSDVLLSKRSIAAAYSPRIEGILYGPHHLTLELLEKLIGAQAATGNVSA